MVQLRECNSSRQRRERKSYHEHLIVTQAIAEPSTERCEEAADTDGTHYERGLLGRKPERTTQIGRIEAGETEDGHTSADRCDRQRDGPRVPDRVVRSRLGVKI